jgi:nitrous oxidase accessory protein
MRDGMFSKITMILLLTAMLTPAFTIQLVKAVPKTWTVDDNGPADFHTIQEAINAVNSGDYIYVINGTYVENVVVNKTVWLVGQQQNITIIDGNEAGTVVNVTVDNVVVTGFTIRNSSSSPGLGIYGIYLNDSEGSVINNNDLTDNVCNIALNNSNNNEIIHNTMLTYADCGLNLTNSNDNDIALNLILDNKVGISLGEGSGGNNITRNEIKLSSQCGILANSGGNVIFHNKFINNVKQVLTDSINIWDNSTTPDTSGGNYWSDYGGSDPDGDGIGNTPYTIDASNIDAYPLIRSPDSSLLLVDVNDDRIINIRDVYAIVKAFNSYPHSSRWNFFADTDKDLRVNIKDLMPVLTNFGKRYP